MAIFKESTWKYTKEKILMFFGLGLIAFEVGVAENIGLKFHFEILLTGLALCGISIAQWKDKA